MSVFPWRLTYFHEKETSCKLKNTESVVRFHDKHFSFNFYHSRNLLSSLSVLKGFKTLFQDTEKKVIEIMEKSERSYLVCNVTKNAKKHTQLYH